MEKIKTEFRSASEEMMFEGWVREDEETGSQGPQRTQLYL
jgi:hypothetical protein